MRTIPLSKGLVAKVDDADFEWLSSYSWHAAISPYSTSPYARTTIYLGGGRKNLANTSVMMHRLLLDAKKGQFVDHINHDGLDNRRCNLRRCDRGQNGRNSRKKAGVYASDFKGVGWCKRRKKWTACVNVNGRRTLIGRFDDEEDAAIAYDVAAQVFYGAFAKLNKS